MTNISDQIKNLAFTVSDGLIVYVGIHDKIFKEAATVNSFFKNIFGRGVPMSELLHDAEKLIPIWNEINEKIVSFGRDAYSLMSKEEKYYFEILSRYAQAVHETAFALIDRQKLLTERSKGNRNNSASWNLFQEAERTYQSAIQKYMAIGQELENASHLIF